MKSLPVFLILLCAVMIAVVLHSRTVAAKQEVMDAIGPAMKELQPSLRPGETIGLWNTTGRPELLPWCRNMLAPVVLKDYQPGQPADTVLALANKWDTVAQGIIVRVANGNVLRQVADSSLSYTLLWLPHGAR